MHKASLSYVQSFGTMGERRQGEGGEVEGGRGGCYRVSVFFGQCFVKRAYLKMMIGMLL